MTKEDARQFPGSHSNKRPTEVTEFADHVEKQAHILHQAGWVQDASNLREWARELRNKAAAAHLRLQEQEGMNRF
jgi:hypothetical protein